MPFSRYEIDAGVIAILRNNGAYYVGGIPAIGPYYLNSLLFPIIYLEQLRIELGLASRAQLALLYYFGHLQETISIQQLARSTLL